MKKISFLVACLFIITNNASIFTEPELRQFSFNSGEDRLSGQIVSRTE